jgi:TRAP-type C4-dicarboxylate transport system substrate-binding protein
MRADRLFRFALAAGALAAAAPAAAIDLTYGSWPPAGEYLNRVALPKSFATIAKETNGAITWKLVPGGQLADPKGSFTAVSDGLIHGALHISIYVPNLVPSVNTIYSTNVYDDDVVAASGAALETLTLNCPSCLEEYRKLKAVPLAAWTSSSYHLTCREPVRSLAELKGKRVRATGGNHDLMSLGGAVPVAATLVETVGLLQRGGLDCQFGVHTWTKIFGYGDVAKHVTDVPLGLSGPAIGLPINREAWNKMTLDQKKLHMREASRISAELALGQFVLENEQILKELQEKKGVNLVKGNAAEFAGLTAKHERLQREKNIEAAKKFGVANPAAIIDAYDAARKKWKPLSRQIGRDIDKFAAAIQREVYDKVDPNKF